MRNMSFSKTIEQVRNRTKTVTRRFGWWDLKPGTRLWAIEKGQGLKKGEKVKRICQIEVVSVRKEQVQEIMCYDESELAKEGFPNMAPVAFIRLLCDNNFKKAHYNVNRIEFKYL